MSDETLVSVIIPTMNSGATIETCLKSIKEQTYPNIEVVVVDSYSKDVTRKIAEKFGASIVLTREKLLGARYCGLNESRGKNVMLLDSDQILDRTAIARALEMLREWDMICLEERSYKPKTWIQRLFEADRDLIHNLANIQLDPMEGTLLARFYKREILKRAFEAIPKEIMPIVVAHDHAIIYYEAYKISHRVGILSNAVWHIEPESLIDLWKKNYRYGRTAKDLIKRKSYCDLLTKKLRFRKGTLDIRNVKHGTSSFLLLVLKGIAYQIGYLSG